MVTHLDEANKVFHSNSSTVPASRINNTATEALNFKVTARGIEVEEVEKVVAMERRDSMVMADSKVRNLEAKAAQNRVMATEEAKSKATEMGESNRKATPTKGKSRVTETGVHRSKVMVPEVTKNKGMAMGGSRVVVTEMKNRLHRAMVEVTRTRAMETERARIWAMIKKARQYKAMVVQIFNSTVLQMGMDS
ncbi:hypothetical protein ISCGN_001044 [Ixodes scapularis]